MNRLFAKTQELCRKYGIQPARSKGQNFLIEESVYEKIIENADLKQDDIVLEVGPGLGFLTEQLARIVKKVIAVELDDKLAKALSAKLKEQGIGNVEVVNEDIFKISNFQFLPLFHVPWLAGSRISPPLAECGIITNFQ